MSSDRDQTSSAAAAAAVTAAASATSGNPRHDMTDVEKRRLQSSMTELCNRLRAISSQNLAPPPDAPSRRSRSRSRAGSTEAAAGVVVDEAEELERRTGDTFDHNATIKDELKTMASGSPAMLRSSPKASSPNTNNSKATLNADGKAARPLLKNQGSTSFEDSRTVEGGSVDYSTDNYLSDISCDIP